MMSEEELEKSINNRLFSVKQLFKKLITVITFQIGGVSILGLVIIVGAIIYSFQLLEKNLFDKLNFNPESKRVGPLQLKGNYVVSLIAESGGSIQSQTTADKLIDGVMGTQAAPGNTNIDYVVDLGGKVEVHEVALYWGALGTDPNYITNWTLEGKYEASDDSPWIGLADGGFPLATKSLVKVDNKELSQLRIRAEGANYIGIYELSVVGKRVNE